MADFYVDHGAYATNIGATPTWGVPQEGDGSTKDAATASSTASVQFTANATAASSTISVCGVTFSAVASGATGNQFNVGGALTNTLDNLVAAINASTTAVASGVAVGVPQLRNLVFARKSGTDTLEIMSRVGSATCNNATNANWSLTTANWTNNGVSNFAGGSGGCWGWMLNQAAIGVSSSIAAMAYGVFAATEMVRAATLTEFDTIWARTASDKTITYSSTNYNLTVGGTGRRIIADSNVKWTGDSGTGKIIFDLTYTGNSGASTLYIGNNSINNLGAVKQGGITFRFRCTGTNNSVRIGTGSSSGNSGYLLNVDLEDLTTQLSSGIEFTTLHQGTLALRGCRYSRPIAATAVRNLYNPSAFAAQHVRFDACSFAWNITGLSNPGAPFTFNQSLNQEMSLAFSGSSFTGWPSGNDKFQVFASSGASAAVQCHIDNCTGVLITSAFSGLMIGGVAADHNRYGYSYQGGGLNGEFRHEQRNGITEWDPGAAPAFPTLSATLMDGSTPWSIRAIWALTVGAHHGSEFRAAQLRQFNRLASATRTIKLEMFLRTALFNVLNPANVSMLVSYIDATTDKMVTETTVLKPVSSVASWTGAGSWAGYEAAKLELTTAAQVKLNTEIMVSVRLLGAVPTAQNENVFIDPDFAVI